MTPYGQRSNFTDHISLDFGTSMIVGNHSASNSIYSIDGLNRYFFCCFFKKRFFLFSHYHKITAKYCRSSIGCNQRCTFRDPGDVVVHNVDFNDNSSASISIFYIFLYFYIFIYIFCSVTFSFFGFLCHSSPKLITIYLLYKLYK